MMSENYVPEFAKSISNKNSRLVTIPKELLLIDSSYQNPANLEEVTRIRNGWNQFLCNPLSVAERYDGRYYVVDGQHRLLAAKQISNIKSLPCMVFHSDGAQEEAQLYYQCNNNRRKPSVAEKYKSLLVAGDPTRVHISNSVKEKGFSTNRGTKRSITVGSLVYVYDVFGEAAFDKMLDIIDKLYLVGAAEPRVVKGIGYIVSGKYNIPDYDTFEKTILKIGATFLGAGIKEHVFSCGKSSVPVFAEGIAIRVNSQLNKSPKKKITPFISTISKEVMQ